MTVLESTGERIIEDRYLGSAEEYLIYSMHVATYEHVRALVTGKHVLDFGCGTGYGTARLAEQSGSITGVDVSAEAIAYAGEQHGAPNARFEAVAPVERAALPFDDAQFDVVLSFQVIEHLPDVDAYLREARRVLRQDGTLVLATPDRSTRLLPRQRPWNRFHIVEYSDATLARVLSKHFSEVEMLHMSGAPGVIGAEIRRTRRNMILALPLTLPGIPERVRTRGLELLRTVNNAVRRRTPDNAGPRSFSFDHESIRIGPGLTPSVNLVAHCRGPR